MAGSVEKINVEINAKDNATKVMKKVGDSTFSLKKLVGGLSIAWAGVKIKNFIDDSIQSYKVQEQANAQLEVAIGNLKDLGAGYDKTAGGAAKATKELEDFASALQDKTAFADEDIVRAEASLATFKLTTQSIKMLTPALLDMAAAQSSAGGEAMDLTSAAEIMGKAVAGNIGTLSRYGIMLTDAQKKQFMLGDATERTRILTELLGEKYGGTAEKMVQTTQGALTQAANQWDDFKETIGEILAPLLVTISGWIVEAAQFLKQGIADIRIAWETDWNGMRTTVIAVWAAVKTAFSIGVEAIKFGLNVITMAIQGWRDFLNMNIFSGEHSKFWKEYGTMITAIFIGAKEAIQFVIDKLYELTEAVRKFNLGKSIGGLADFQSKFPAPTIKRAAGGRILNNQTSLVGERGPEYFTPSQSGVITPNSAGGGSTTLNFAFNGPVSNKDVAMEYADEIIRQFKFHAKAV